MSTIPAPSPVPDVPELPPHAELQALRCAAQRLANDANSLMRLPTVLSNIPPEYRLDHLRKKLSSTWFTYRRLVALMSALPCRPPDA